MLSRITDLFLASASRYSSDQINLFDEVIAKLARAIEAKARAKLAIRLAARDQCADGRHPDARLRRRHRGRAPGAAASPSGCDEADLLANATQQEPAPSRRHFGAQVAERGRDRRAGRARRSSGGAFGREESRRALFRRGLPHAGQAFVERRRSGHAGRRAARPAAPAFPAPARSGFGRRAARLTAENPAAGEALEGVLSEVVGDIQSETRKVSDDLRPRARRSRRSAAPAAWARTTSIALRASATSRKPPSPFRSSAASSSTWSSAAARSAATRSR